MYTFYCFPNIFLPLFGGHLIDKFGQRTMIIVFTSCIFVGQFIVSYGCTSLNFHLILFGRAIFGIGESLNISIITILSSYFAQGELAFAIILLFLSTRLCNFLNLIISPVIELDHGVSAAFWVGTLICVLGVVSALILSEFDEALKFPYAHDRYRSSQLEIGMGTHHSSRSVPRSDKKDPYGIFAHVSKNSSLITKTKPSVPSRLPVVLEDATVNEAESVNSANNIIAYLNHKQEGYGTFMGPPPATTTLEETSEMKASGNWHVRDAYADVEAQHKNDKGEDDQNKYHHKGYKPFSAKTLCSLFFLCFFLYGAILPFLDMANPIIHIGFFQDNKSDDMTSHEVEKWVTRLQTIPIVILAVCAPCVAVVVDYWGHRPVFFVLASTLLAFSHGMIASRLGNISVLGFALVLIGLAHS